MPGETAKRQRANTNGDSTDPSKNIQRELHDYKSIIDSFDEKTIRALLLSVARHFPEAATFIVRKRDRIREKESVKVIDFDYQSKNAWHALNNSNNSRNGSGGYHAGIEAAECVEQIIQKIREQAPAHASFGTKKSALVTLRKIGKSVALGGQHDEFGSQVVNSLDLEGSPLETAMMEIVKGMEEDEKVKMRSDKEWVQKVRELIELGKDIDMFDALDEMLEILRLVEEQ